MDKEKYVARGWEEELILSEDWNYRLKDISITPRTYLTPQYCPAKPRPDDVNVYVKKNIAGNSSQILSAFII